MFTRRSLLRASAAAGVLPLLARVDAARAAAPLDGKTVRVLSVVADQFTAQEKRSAAFTAKTGARVVYTYVPFQSMREALSSELVAGGGNYDVIAVMDQWATSVRDLFRPLQDDLNARGIDPKRYPDTFLAAGQIGGDLIGLPLRGHVQMLFYRKDLFAKHDIAPPQTWDDVGRAAKILRDNENISGIAINYGKSAQQNLYLWYDFVWANGGEVMTADGKPAFNSPAAIKGTQDFVGLLKAKAAAPGSVDFDEQDAVNSMVQGKSAMLPAWWWSLSVLTDPRRGGLKPEQVGFVTLPTVGDAPHVTYTNTWVFGVAKTTPEPEAALQYLAWLTDPALERDILLDRSINEIVAVQWSNLDDPAVNARFAGLQHFAAAELKDAKIIHYDANYPQVAQTLASAVSEIAGGADPQSTLDGAASTLKRVLQ